MNKIQKLLLVVLLFGAFLAPKSVEAGMLNCVNFENFEDVFVTIFTKFEDMFPQVVRTEPCTPEVVSAVNKVVAPMLEKNVKLLEEFNTQYELFCKTPWVSVVLPSISIKAAVSGINYLYNAAKLKLYARNKSGCVECKHENCKVFQNANKKFAAMEKSVDAMNRRVANFKRKNVKE